MAGRDRWMLCQCRGEHYAIHLRWAQEILYRPQLLPLPGLDATLAGLIIWRGQTLPVIGPAACWPAPLMPRRSRPW